VIAAVFLAGRDVAAGGLRRCPAPQAPAGGGELLLSWEVFNSGGRPRRRAGSSWAGQLM